MKEKIQPSLKRGDFIRYGNNSVQFLLSISSLSYTLEELLFQAYRRWYFE